MPTYPEWLIGSADPWAQRLQAQKLVLEYTRRGITAPDHLRIKAGWMRPT